LLVFPCEMSKLYREPSERQILLLPPSLEDWLPEGHLARFVVDVVDELDLRPIERVVQGKDHRGTRPYSPKLMVGLLFYCYATGRFSSRRIARACVEDVAVRYLARDTAPHHSRISAFRQEHLSALAALFVAVLDLCRAAGLVKTTDVWLDGTKIKANASKHKAMSYAGMKEREAKLAGEIDELLKRAKEEDAKEDKEFGEGKDESDGVRPEIQRRESRREFIRKHREKLEEEAKKTRAAELRDLAKANNARTADEPDPAAAKAAATRAEKQIQKAAELDNEPKDPPPGPPDSYPAHRPAAETDGKPVDGAQRNFTDPDSKIMKNGQGAFEQAYNAQAVVGESHIIIATGLSNMAADAPHLPVMLARTEQALGEPPRSATADNGYYSEDNVLSAVTAGVQPYFAMGRERRTWPPSADSAGAPPDQDAKAWMSWQLKTKEGREQMRLRKCKVELVFGVIKQAMGFRQFLLRGLKKVRGEWALVCLAYNLRKLHGATA
jgi:transposase